MSSKFCLKKTLEALGGGTVRQDVHPPQAGHGNRGKEDHLVANSSIRAGDMEE